MKGKDRMRKRPLVLSLFPGSDLLGLAFELEWPEACVVRGPDPVWGSLHDIRRFCPPSGVFDGVIGGPPCQAWSSLAHLVRHNGYEVQEDLIPEFVRCIAEARPRWFVMENVQRAPDPDVTGYAVSSVVLNNRWTGEPQNRLRRFWFGLRGAAEPVSLWPYLKLWDAPLSGEYGHAVLARGFLTDQRVERRRNADILCAPLLTEEKRRIKKSGPTYATVAEGLHLQGLPPDFFADSPFTVEGQQRLLGNGVPLPMGRAVARAVRRALAALDHAARPAMRVRASEAGGRGSARRPAGRLSR